MKSQNIISINPSTYQPLGEIEPTSHQAIDAALVQARTAYGTWSTLAVTERVACLERVYQEFVRRRNDIARVMAQEMGMPLKVCDAIEVDLGLNFMRGYLDNAAAWLAPEIVYESQDEIHHLWYEPRGVMGVSVPWNYPFSNFIWGVMQNLVVGNTVVCKHSEECVLTSKLFAEILEHAQLPQGVCTIIYGTGEDVGDYLMRSALDGIWFTGSTRVGKHLYQLAAQRLIPAILELGGSAAGMVFEDADLAATIPLLYNNRFLNSGQTCDGLKRLIVHESMFAPVVRELQQLVATKKVGPAEDRTTDIGPLVAERQVFSIEAQVADAVKKGATVVCGGKRPAQLKGAYYEPTILTNITRDMLVWKEEVFGPVLPVVAFKTEEEAIALANDSQYGLGGFIYTSNKERALRVGRRLQTGNINVNSATYVIPQDPFGGYKNSGLGREHGKIGLRELMQCKVIALKK